MGCGASNAEHRGAAASAPIGGQAPATSAPDTEPPGVGSSAEVAQQHGHPTPPGKAHISALPRPTLPVDLDGVGIEFVTDALAREGYIKEDTRIVSFEKIKYGREKGYLGDKCLLTGITYEPPASKAPNSIFVKLFPTSLTIPAAVCTNMWHMELNFVTRMVKDLPNSDGFRVPQFYFAAYDEEEEGKPPRFVILMEHINGKPCDILSSMPFEHALSAAKDLAILHAPYWGWSHARFRDETDEGGLKKFEGYGHMEDAGRQQSFQGLFTHGTNVGLKIFGTDGPLSPAQLEHFSGYVEFWRFYEAEIWPLLQKRWCAVLARWTRIPSTLIHGDFHCENMLCLDDGSNVYIDFQSVSLGPGLRDLAWLVASSLDEGGRRAHEETIVRAYHEALTSRGVAYVWEQCWEDFIFMKIHGLFAGMLGAGIFADKNFKEKDGIFAPEPSGDAILERKRNCALFSRVVDDMRHSKWPAMLQGLAPDPEGE